MSTEDEEGREQRRPWNMDRTINVSHILTTVVIATSALALFNKMDNRVTVLETSQSYLAVADQRLERDTQEKVALVRDELREINRKLDRLIDGKRGAGT